MFIKTSQPVVQVITRTPYAKPRCLKYYSAGCQKSTTDTPKQCEKFVQS